MIRTCVFAVLTVLTTSSAVNAAEVVVDAAGYTKVAVSYSDLDLSRTMDAQLMLSRLHSAARKVCSRTFSEGEISTHGLYRACEKQALEHAVSSVNAPLVAQLYRAPHDTDAVSRLATN